MNTWAIKKMVPLLAIMLVLGIANLPKAYATNYNYYLHGPYQEYISADSLRIIVYPTNAAIYAINMTANQTLTLTAPGGFITFDNNGSMASSPRRIYLSTPEEDLYIHLPLSEYTTYLFTVVDLAGITNAYLESLLNINGTYHIVERWGMPPMQDIPFEFSLTLTYRMRLVCDQGTYIFGDYAAINATQSYSLLVTKTMFPTSVINTYKYVHIYANRSIANPYGSISVMYEDLLEATTNVSIYIKLTDGTVVNSTYVEDDDAFTYVYGYADNSTDYIVDATVLHEDIGTMQWRQFLYHTTAMTETPFGLDFLGTSPIPTYYIIPTLIIIFAAGCFSVLNRELGAFVALCLAILLTAMQWIPIGEGVLVAAMSFTILIVLLKGKKGETYA